MSFFKKLKDRMFRSSDKIGEGLEALVNPAHAMELALKGTDTAVAAGRLFLRSPDPKTLFKGKLGVAKRAAWSQVPSRKSS